jgi:nitrous oxidase accessory protein
MENSSGNEIKGNEFAANFVGSQLNKINKNSVAGNIFISNVTDVQATKGTENLIRKNYWDAALKLDTDGDGKSNLVHRADPFFLNLTKETPPYQLFFQHPGLVLLQKMLKSPEHMLVTDEEPLMTHASHNHDQTEANQGHFWSISLGLIMSSFIIIYFGRKKV